MAESTTSQDYITSDNLKADMSMSGNTFADASIANSITAASRMIDHICSRFFYQDSATTTRTYTPTRYDRLSIHDLVTLTSFATDLDGSFAYAQPWTVNRDFLLNPVNAPLTSWPYTEVTVLPVTAQYALDPTIINSVQITGIFGWPSVPLPVQEATTILASQLVKRKREAPFGIMSYDGMAMRLGQLDTQVKSLLGPYIKHRMAIG